MRSRTSGSARVEYRNDRGVSDAPLTARRAVGFGSPSYRSSIEGHNTRSTRRLAIAFRAVSALGVLCLIAAGLAAGFSLAAPTSATHGVVRAGASELGLSGTTRLMAARPPGPLLIPNTAWLGQGANSPADKVLGSGDDVSVRDAAPKAPPVAAAPPAARSALGLASTAGAGAGVAVARSRGVVTIESFGYNFAGAPSGSRFVADVRNIPTNGFDFTQDENGLMPSVRERVMSTAEARTWLSVMRSKWLPALSDGDTVAIGCARGHHRSVTLAVLFAEDLRAAGYTVKVVHRDIYKTW